MRSRFPRNQKAPQDAQKEIAKNLVTFSGGGADAPAAKESIINIIAAKMKISPDDAAKRFNDTQAKLQQAKDKAVHTAKNAADGAGMASERSRFNAVYEPYVSNAVL